MKTHYFPDAGDGWTALCGRKFTLIDNTVSAYGMDDLSCESCRAILKKRGLPEREMHPLVAGLIVRRAITASEVQRDMALKTF